MSEFIFILYVCFLLGLTVFLLTLLVRFVKAHERIAGALERLPHVSRRE